MAKQWREKDANRDNKNWREGAKTLNRDQIEVQKNKIPPKKQPKQKDWYQNKDNTTTNSESGILKNFVAFIIICILVIIVISIISTANKDDTQPKIQIKSPISNSESIRIDQTENNISPAQRQYIDDTIQEIIIEGQNSNHPKAADLAESILDIDPSNTEALQYLGLAHMHMGNHQLSINALQRANSISGGEDPDIKLNLSRAYYYNEEYNYANTILNELINQGYDDIDIDIYVMKGAVLIKEDEYDEALRRTKQGLSKEPDNYYLLNNMARIYHYQRKNEIAIKYVKKIINLYPDEPHPKEFLQQLESDTNN